MKLELTGNGFTIDAADLGRLLERPPTEVQRLMREGVITTRFERGEGDDEGRSRVTFFDESRRVRLIVDADGEVLKRSRVSAPPPPGRPDQEGPAPAKRD